MKISHVLLDLDGTVWRWNELISNVKKTIKKLKKKRKVYFITNNTVLPREMLLRKLEKFGIKVEAQRLITASESIARYLQAKQYEVLCFGDGLKADLIKQGIELREDTNVDCIAIGHDLRFDYSKLFLAYKALRKKCEFVASSKGKFWIVGDELYPGTGAIVELLEYLSQVKAKILGKPSRFMLELVLKRLKCRPKEVLMVGDEQVDIEFGKLARFKTVFVKTGVEKCLKTKPDFVLPSLSHIFDILT